MKAKFTQTAGDPRITSTGKPVGPGTFAASRDLLNLDVSYGMIVPVVEERGSKLAWRLGPDMWLEVPDTLHSRIQKRVAVWRPSCQQTNKWGRYKVVLEAISTLA